MKPTIIAAAVMVVVSACSQETETLEAKKDKLYSLREQRNDLNTEMAALEDEIRKEDPDFENVEESSTLVSIMEVPKQNFRHQIEVRGSVESHQNIMISAETPGRIKEIRIKPGQRVKKGDLLLVIDSESIERQIDELETQLSLAKVIFERQSNLWEQKVGSEIQYLEAKNRKESLENRLAASGTEFAKTRIRAPFNGSVDNVPVKAGEFAMAGMPMVRIVSLDDLYLSADVSERYVGKFKKSDEVEVYLPSLDRQIVSRITAVSDVINLDNRTFSVEADLSDLSDLLKPNMVVIVKLTDYRNDDAVVIPTNIIQNDDQGPYVFTVHENGGTKEAKKLHLEIGNSFNSMTEIKNGIGAGQVVINSGFRELADGMTIKVVDAES